MALSDEEKNRILEEEKARLEEEQYRAQVRRELQNQSRPAAQAPANSRTLRLAFVVVGIIAVLCAGFFVSLGHRSIKSTASGPSNAAPTPVKGLGPFDKPSPVIPAKLSTAQIAERATRSVVIVENFNEDGEKAGQGVDTSSLTMAFS